ncbi:MAG: aldehyde dehydrogenase family protein [Planctomycetota bacterium]
MSILASPPADLIGGSWSNLSGDKITSTNPARPEHILWQGTPVREHVDQAVEAARAALPAWSDWPIERRAEVLQHFAKLCTERVEAMAQVICAETGKAWWDSKAEAGLLAAKVKITLDTTTQNFGRTRVTGYDIDLSETKQASAWFKPHGVMACVGPFNFPAHLPNGHIVPALFMGNTIVFKPSDKTPAVGQLLIEYLDEALRAHNAPPGVVNLVQGDAENAAALVAHPGLDGILFTGSWPVGRRILESNLDHPGKIIALEMGGNNPAVVMPDADLRQAAIEVVRGAFVTTGQRCTCTRRLIVHESVADPLIAAVCKTASNLVVNDPKADPVFMGPLVTADARDNALAFQSKLSDADAEIMLQMTGDIPAVADSGGHYITPGIARIDRFTSSTDNGSGFDAGCDEEVFGPLLRVSVVKDLDDAIAQANATRFGLAAAVFTKDEATAKRFRAEVRAGCINWNSATAGASSALPFGGLGISGNHRPAGSFSLDYCAYPVAGMTERGDAAGLAQGMTFEDEWLS